MSICYNDNHDITNASLCVIKVMINSFLETFVTIFLFVVDRVTYLILAGENNHYGGISLDEKKNSRVVTQLRTPLERTTDSIQHKRTN